MFQEILEAINGDINGEHKKIIKGRVALMKKNVLDFNDVNASILDRVHEFLGKKVHLQLISAVNNGHSSSEKGLGGKLGSPAYLEDWITTITPLNAGESVFNVTFDWEEDMGVPGAFILPSETPAPLNDLGEPDKAPKYARPVLGGSSEYPYPRRGRTGRPPAKIDPESESRLPLLMSLNIYVPRDEQFGHLKLSDFLAYALKSIAQFLLPEFEALCDSTPNEFDTLQDVLKLYEGGIELPEGPLLDRIRENIPLEMLKELVRTDGEGLAKFPLRRINAGSAKIYATRTLLFLQKDGTLKPLVIELSLPHPEGDQYGAVSKVYTPAEEGVEGSIWQLAKAYVAVNDSGIHQLISHWLNTHAVIEPFVIATNRQLSVLHPIHKLLQPHFRDTMTINAFGRQILINGGGILERTVFPGQYAMEMSSVVYKNWKFPEQALPADLIKRGMAMEDSNSRHGIRLVIEDYPYAVDGLEIWSAIKTWVEEYCNFYYKTDEMVQNDNELQLWWKELQEEGHGDKKNEAWWPKMQTLKELIDSCTIIIWIGSALHAAVNFGQYPYAGYLPNRPTLSRRYMPEPGTPEYDELKADPEKVYMKTITPQLQTLLGISLIEILSRHSSDEVYLGQRATPAWTKDTEPLNAFEKFGKKLEQIEEQITEMNNDPKLKNRVGPVKMPYTLLYPSSKGGLTGKGIPNSVSI